MTRAELLALAEALAAMSAQCDAGNAAAAAEWSEARINELAQGVAS